MTNRLINREILVFLLLCFIMLNASTIAKPVEETLTFHNYEEYNIFLAILEIQSIQAMQETGNFFGKGIIHNFLYSYEEVSGKTKRDFHITRKDKHEYTMLIQDTRNGKLIEIQELFSNIGNITYHKYSKGGMISSSCFLKEELSHYCEYPSFAISGNFIGS